VITHVSASEPEWTGKLSDTLKQSKDGDIIVVSSETMLELAIGAAKRMNKWPLVRIMTEQTYGQERSKSE
jgi:hypothetical protein